MSKYIATFVVALVVGIVIGAAVQSAKPLGGVTIEDETFVGTVTAADLASTDDVTVGDDLIVTEDLFLSDNDFCIEFYATSTATAVKMYASSTATIEGSDGVIMFTYGSCDE